MIASCSVLESQIERELRNDSRIPKDPSDPQPESQKPRQRVSNVDQKVFANPESFWDKFIIG